MVGHDQTNAGGSNDASDDSREQGDEDANVDEDAKEWNSALGCEEPQRSGGLAKTSARGVEAGRFGIATDNKEEPCDKGAAEDRVRDVAQRVSRLGAKRCGAFKAREAQNGKHDAKTDAGKCHPVR
jgi:hypothetical protein